MLMFVEVLVASGQRRSTLVIFICVLRTVYSFALWELKSERLLYINRKEFNLTVLASPPNRRIIRRPPAKKLNSERVE